MAPVLLLGNGISRLLFGDFIEGWSGECWGANYIFRELGHKLTRLTGHGNVMDEAVANRAEHGHLYKIMGRVGNEDSREMELTCPAEFRKDSGTVLAAQAHEEGFAPIHVCGYDLGGPDVLSPQLHLQFKAVWVRRWRQLLDHYGPDRVRFVGYNHLPYLLSDEPADLYQRRYRAGLPHIPDPDYIALHRLVMGPNAGWRNDRMAKVRWLVQRPGWETEYKDTVALKLADKGLVEIISERVVEDRGDETELNDDTKVTARMNVATLRRIAEIRGIDGADDMTRADLLDLLRE